jgi:probable F420-dependent oxidoreductase
VAEHLITPTSFAKVYPYNSSGDPGYQPETPLADPWVLIGHLAAHTTKVKLGTGVFILPLRNPIATARAVATAQLLSGGRVLLGVGTGWMEEEFAAAGERWEGRGSRTDEIIDILHKLWSGKRVSHAGRWYSFNEVQMAPSPEPMPPIIVGGVSKPALRRAARLGDAWYGPACSFEESAAYRDEILRLLAEAGRDRANFRFHARLNSPVDAQSLSRARAMGLEDFVLVVPYSVAGLDEKLDRIASLADEIQRATAAL